MKQLSYLFLILLAAVSLSLKKPAAATVVYQDDLVTGNRGWYVDSNKFCVLKFAQGHYSIRVDSPDHCVRSLAPYGLITFPYAVQVDGITVLDDTSKCGNLSVVFNQTDNSNFYMAEIWTDGTYRIWRRVDGVNSTIVNFTYDSAIRAGSGCKNTIRLIQRKFSMEFQVNGVSLGIFKIRLPSSLIGTGPTVATVYRRFTAETGLFNNFSISEM